MNDNELLENILTADILILAKCLDIENKRQGSGGGSEHRAIYEIKSRRAELIKRLHETNPTQEQ